MMRYPDWEMPSIEVMELVDYLPISASLTFVYERWATIHVELSANPRV
jgi:hypothetical protein